MTTARPDPRNPFPATEPLPEPTPGSAPDPAARPLRRVFVRDLVVACLIGVHRHERDGKQRVRVNLDLRVEEHRGPLDDKLSHVVSYETLVEGVRRLADGGHINLVETLAERIAAMCLEDRRVRDVVVRVEKLDVFADAASAGVEIQRENVLE